MTLPFVCVYQGSPAIIQAPQPATPTSATTGGTIAASAVVKFSVSAVSGSTETLATASPTVTVGAGTSTNTATVTWPLIPGATSYNVYAATGAGTLAKVGTSTNGTFTWTGSAGSGAVPGSSGFTEGTLWTPSGGTSGLVLGVVVSNPTVYDGQLYLSRIPVAGANAGVAQRIVAGTPVPPDAITGQPLDLSRKHAFAAGDQLTGYVTVPGMVLTVDALVG